MLKAWLWHPSRALAVSVAVGALFVTSGCSGTNGPSVSASVPSWLNNYQPPSSGCGSFTASMPGDPDRLIASLDAQHRAAYPGYSAYQPGAVQVIPTSWASWHPNHPPPYTVDISWSALVSNYQVQMVDLLQKELTQAGFRVTLRTTSQLNVPEQLSQFHALVLSRPDFIILETPSPDAFIGPINQAAAQRIPTLSFDGYVASANAITLDVNFYLAHALMTSAAVRLLAGKGNVVYMHSISGVTIDLDANAAWDAILKRCPGIHKVGELYGGFSDSLAKSQMLQFLATHPESIGAVFPTASMSVGIMQAFVQTGRPAPVVTDVGPTNGRLGYIEQHKSYAYVAVAFTPQACAAALVDVTRRMLDGQGVRMNVLLAQVPLVTNFNASEYSKPGWSLGTPGVAPGIPGQFFSDSYIAAFFAHPRQLRPLN
jgi:ribose transport system substrate-binding protein